MSFPTHGTGGGSGFHDLTCDDGATRCVLDVEVYKRKYAFVASWADSRWFLPQVGWAEGDVSGTATAEENELGGCPAD